MCCRHVDQFSEMSHLDKGNGICKYLNGDNKCDIYYSRPNICNGEYIYRKFYSHITVEEYHNIVHGYCNAIRSQVNERLYKN